jgi:tetratricopeptide (TPR) repeat protein
MADEHADAMPFSGGGAALGAALLGGADNPRVDQLLERQIALADLQIDNLKKQDEYETSHLRWRRFNDQMSGALQLMLVAIGLLIVAGIGAAIWSAMHDNGLVIEAFSVPPDLAAKGLSGEVIAGKVLARLSQFQAETVSARASESYANNWGDDIKVQIPNTGVSIGEFNRALHEWLGRETRISGEIYRTPDGLAIAARAGGDSTPTFKGREADIDTLIDQVAQRIYRSTQPYRYAAWLEDHGGAAESRTILETIAETGTPLERGWAYNGLAHLTIVTGNIAEAEAYITKAVAADPSLLQPRGNMVGGEQYLGRDEAALAAARDVLRVSAAGDPSLTGEAFTRSVLSARLLQGFYTGDYAVALATAHQEAAQDAESGHEDEELTCAFLHDASCVANIAALLGPAGDAGTRENRDSNKQQIATALERWDQVLSAADRFHAERLHGPPILNGLLAIYDAPLHALAAAHLGDFELAHRLIDPTPGDCNPCLRIRGALAALEHRRDAADWWFAKAEAAAPSIPQVDVDWGRVLIAQGAPDRAIAKLALAHKKGPLYADPLELWGEALLQQNRADLALAKFAEANRHAPHWARLHLKWGEALWWSGDKAAARKQWNTAATLGLSHDEQAERTRMER